MILIDILFLVFQLKLVINKGNKMENVYMGKC